MIKINFAFIRHFLKKDATTVNFSDPLSATSYMVVEITGGREVVLRQAVDFLEPFTVEEAIETCQRLASENPGKKYTFIPYFFKLKL